MLNLRLDIRKTQISAAHANPTQHSRGYAPSLKQQALAMVLDGNGIRQAARHVGVNHVSILNWIKQGADSIASPSIEEAPIIEVDGWIKMIHSWQYVQKKNSLQIS